MHPRVKVLEIQAEIGTKVTAVRRSAERLGSLWQAAISKSVLKISYSIFKINYF